MRRLLGLVLVAALGWSAYWVVASRALERNLTTWLAERRAEGWQADIADLSVSGYPNRLDATFRDITLADPETGLAWRAPFFQLFALSYRPHHIIAIWPDIHSIATPQETVTLNAKRMRASMALRPEPALGLERMTLELAGLKAQSDRGWWVGLPQAVLAMEDLEQDAPTYRLGFTAKDVALPPELVDLLGVRLLPSVIKDIHLDARAGFDRPWDRRALEQRRPQPRRIDLQSARIQWGDMALDAAGQVDVDAAGWPDGTITVRATNWRDILRVAERSGLLPRDLMPALERGLSLLAGLSGRADTIDVPLRLAGGRIFLGPVPLGAAPRLVLR